MSELWIGACDGLLRTGGKLPVRVGNYGERRTGPPRPGSALGVPSLLGRTAQSIP
jgi:hypothetical protein